MKKLLIILFLVSQIVISCIIEPSGPETTKDIPASDNAVFILCEGSWGLDNSVLMRYDINTETINEDFYGVANPGLKLGDLANDLVIIDSIALVAVTTSKSIEILDAGNGKSLGRIKYPSGAAPRRIAVIDDSVAAVTDLYRHSISLINFRANKIIADSIPVGPAPEGVAFYDGLLLVVNSGYGDYLANHPKASTVSIIDIAARKELGFFKTGVNPVDVIINKKRRTFYIAYNHLPSKKDSTGGIIEYSLDNLQELRSLKSDVRSMNLSYSGDSLFFISSRGLELVTPGDAFVPQNIIYKKEKNDIWYSTGIQSNGDLWVGNAKNHQIRGEISIYAAGNYALKKTIPGAVNPGKIVFYSNR